MKNSDIKFGQTAVFLLLGLYAQAAFAQGGFQNLDFEAGVRTPLSPDFISAADALSGWTARLDDTVFTAVWGFSGFDGTSVALLDSTTGHTPLEGSFSVELFGNSADPAYQTASISQTGTIPTGTQSIQFLLRNNIIPNLNPSSQDFAVTLNGTPINIFMLSSSGGIMTLGGDISAFNGATAELRFTAFDGGYGLDSIVFSPIAVPEPSALSVLALGLFGLGWYLRRTRQA